MKNNIDTTENWNWYLRIFLSVILAAITIGAVCVLMWLSNQKGGLPGLTLIWFAIMLLGIVSIASCYLIENPKKIIKNHVVKIIAWLERVTTAENKSRLRRKKNRK